MIAGRLLGHAHTLWPVVRETLRPTSLPQARAVKVVVDDDRHGQVALGALHDERGDRETCLIAVHGLGGDAESPYMRTLAAAARRANLDLIRLSLRGADGSGEDIYHAGLTGDLAALIASPALARYRRLTIVGFSLGGHLALRYATTNVDPRVSGVMAIGSPLDLDRSCRDFDERMSLVYRSYVLRHLKRATLALAPGRVPVARSRVRAVRSIREWDATVVAPRFGFRSAEHYYAEASVAPRLGELRVPALYVGANHDPMVLQDSVAAALVRSPPLLRVRWVAVGGHVGFPADLDLGAPGERGLAGQIVALAKRGSW